MPGPTIDLTIYDDEATLLARVLKPGGRLVVEEPDIQHGVVKLVALVERLALMGSHFYAPKEIRAMLDAHGVNVRVEADGHFAAWVVAEKECVWVSARKALTAGSRARGARGV